MLARSSGSLLPRWRLLLFLLGKFPPVNQTDECIEHDHDCYENVRGEESEESQHQHDC